MRSAHSVRGQDGLRPGPHRLSEGGRRVVRPGRREGRAACAVRGPLHGKGAVLCIPEDLEAISAQVLRHHGGAAIHIVGAQRVAVDLGGDVGVQGPVHCPAGPGGGGG